MRVLGAVEVQMGENSETNFPTSLTQQLKIDLPNNWKFVVNIQVHLLYMFIFYVDLIVFCCS
jgi:hypothetical protein